MSEWNIDEVRLCKFYCILEVGICLVDIFIDEWWLFMVVIVFFIVEEY